MCLPLQPHKIEREWEHRGLKCAVVQNREASNRCGYVRVPEGHPCWGVDYNQLYDLEVHGGLTFSGFEPCQEKDGQGYWLGFDCAHAGDLHYDPSVNPQDIKDEATRRSVVFMREFDSLFHGHYWSQEEVEAEAEKLAVQLAGMMEFADSIKEL